MNQTPRHDRFREAIERATQRPAPGVRSTRMFRLKTKELLDAVTKAPATPRGNAPLSDVDEDPFT
jgi:hypothetical protein